MINLMAFLADPTFNGVQLNGNLDYLRELIGRGLEALGIIVAGGSLMALTSVPVCGFAGWDWKKPLTWGMAGLGVAGFLGVAYYIVNPG